MKLLENFLLKLTPMEFLENLAVTPNELEHLEEFVIELRDEFSKDLLHCNYYGSKGIPKSSEQLATQGVWCESAFS